MNTYDLLKYIETQGFSFPSKIDIPSSVEHPKLGDFLLSEPYALPGCVTDALEMPYLTLSNNRRSISKRKWKKHTKLSFSSFSRPDLKKIEDFLVAFCSFCELTDLSLFIKDLISNYNTHACFNHLKDMTIIYTSLNLKETIIIDKNLNGISQLNIYYVINSNNIFFSNTFGFDPLSFFIIDKKLYLSHQQLNFELEIKNPKEDAFIFLKSLFVRFGVKTSIEEYCQSASDLNRYIALKEMTEC